MAIFEPIFLALNQHSVRYVVVGGLATVLHGFARLTADLDLVVDLAPAEAQKTIDVLSLLGFKPRAPVDAMAFADASTRETWVREKGMRVFSLWDPVHPMREIDLFIEHPIEFSLLWERAEQLPLGATFVRIASIPDLILMKRLAGRPEDLLDIEALQEIQRRRTKQS